MSLFREEVFKEKRREWLGPPSIAVPLSYRFLGYASLIIVCGLLFFLFGVHYQKHEHIKGTLVYSYSPVPVIAPISGYILNKSLTNGDEVKAGQIIEYISPAESSFGGSDAEIPAPQEGVINFDSVNVGDKVARGQLLFRIRTSGSHLIARFPVAAKDIQYLSPGGTLVLMFPEVRSRARLAPSGRMQSLQANLGEDSGLYPYILTVSLSHYRLFQGRQEVALVSGLAVEADIPTERRSLMSWILSSETRY